MRFGPHSLPHPEATPLTAAPLWPSWLRQQKPVHAIRAGRRWWCLSPPARAPKIAWENGHRDILTAAGEAAEAAGAGTAAGAYPGHRWEAEKPAASEGRPLVNTPQRRAALR